MKRMIPLLLLVLMVASVTPAHAVNDYYLYPAISYVGDINDLPVGEKLGWTFDCTIFFKGVKIQDMLPTSDSVIDGDKHTIRSFTLSEMNDIRITYYVRAFLHLSTEYLWDGELLVAEQTIEEIDYGRGSWAQYKCHDVSGNWSIGFYAGEPWYIRAVNTETPVVITFPEPTEPDHSVVLAFITMGVICFAAGIGITSLFFSVLRPRRN